MLKVFCNKCELGCFGTLSAREIGIPPQGVWSGCSHRECAVILGLELWEVIVISKESVNSE